MRFLGIDYGKKRVGVAYSDEEGRLAFPKEVLENNSKIIEHILEIIKKEKISEIVIGESLNAAGEANKISAEINSFAKVLGEQTKLPIHKEKEFFSSFEAHGRMGKERNSARQDKFGKTENIDAKAAAVILQRYLDKISK